MSRMIFVNLPVQDLNRSKAFYEAIGFRNEPKFSNDAAAMMVLSETISVMLLTHPFYATFTAKPIADAHEPARCCSASLAIAPRTSTNSSRQPQRAAAGRTLARSRTMAGMMYGRSFEDPDGHHWEPMWMDPADGRTGRTPGRIRYANRLTYV